jgi:hypothetical protein
MTLKLLAASAAVLVFAGCAASKPAAPTIVKDATYGTVAALRDAAVTAGYECPDWHQDNNVGAESGFCRPDKDGSFDQFVTFTDTASRDQHVASAKMFAGAVPDFGALIVGPNWMMRLPDKDVETVQSKLGGTISR